MARKNASPHVLSHIHRPTGGGRFLNDLDMSNRPGSLVADLENSGVAAGHLLEMVQEAFRGLLKRANVLFFERVLFGSAPRATCCALNKPTFGTEQQEDNFWLR
jgi:hypothetical protein